MKKNTVKAKIDEMKLFAAKMPKTITESLDFEGNDMDMDMGEEHGEIAPEVQSAPESSSIDVEKYIDDVRKTALKGMAQLADEPENWGYQTLKKLWQICDKKPEEGQQMQQNRQM